jgi:hypothetical protein
MGRAGHPHQVQRPVRVRVPGERDKHGRRRGHVAWLICKYHWRGVDVWMRASDLKEVEVQDYRRIPRRIADDWLLLKTRATYFWMILQ